MKIKNKDFFSSSLWIASTLLFIFTCIFFYELKLKNEIYVESLVRTFFSISFISTLLFSLGSFLINWFKKEKMTKANILSMSLTAFYMIVTVLLFVLSYIL